jgi:DNA primase
MSATEEIKSRLNIVDVVSDHVKLRKSGSSYSGFCPFHPNTRTPAFYVFPDTQTWYCFGACADGGDLFSYVMKKEGWDFKEALIKLADRAGVVLEETRPVDKAKESAEDRLSGLLAAGADYYHQLLRHAPQAAHARQYVEERKLNDETLSTFQIGYSLDSWDAARTHFESQGYSDDDLMNAGLLSENPDKGTRYDRFRNRLMIPIRDVDNRVVGFGARTLEEDGVPKYLNSPQTALFNKSRLLYGLDRAKPFIREARHVVIVEGYMDVMQAWQAGFRNVVAQMGTALTEEQLRLLKRYAKRFVLALDADAAGLQATMRGLQVARETLDREGDVRFNARGLVRHEARLQADIRVVTLPPGDDPDKIIRSNPDRWPELLDQARPVVDYVINVVTRGLDLDDAKAKTAVAAQVLPLINDIADPIERDHYWQKLARALDVDERALRQTRLSNLMPKQAGMPLKPTRQGTRQDNRPAEAAPADRHQGAPVFRSAPGSTALRQSDYLCQCLHYPRMLIQVNQRLVQHGQPVVGETDFLAAEDRTLLRHMYQHIEGGTVVTIDELCDSLEEPLLRRVHSLLTLPSAPETELDRLADTLVLSVLDWRQEKIKKLSGEVKKLLREASGINDMESLALYRQQMRELPLALKRIDRARDAMSAMSRRRAEEAAAGR